MKHLTWRSMLWLVLLAATAATTAAAVQDKGSGRDPKSDAESRMLKIIDPELLARMLDLADAKKTCHVPNNVSEVVCVIEMRTFVHNGKDYCVAVAPEVTVQISTLTVNKRRLIWQLSTHELVSSSGVAKKLAFHPDSGIIITIDKDKQVDKKGSLGAGPPAPVSPTFFHTFTKRKKPDASTTYLPVILWGESGGEELCAAIDPKIVNVN